MPLSTVQIGVISQNEFAKLVMMGSDGLLEVASPITDDEQRDAEIHIRGQFGSGHAFQIKSATHLQPHGQHSVLQIEFALPANHVISHPRFWYYLSHLSLTTMGFTDPQFLVNSTKFHKYASPRLRDGLWYFSFHASIAEDSRDIWVPDRVRAIEVGTRVVQSMRDQEKLPTAEGTLPDFSQIPGVVWVRRRVR